MDPHLNAKRLDAEMENSYVQKGSAHSSLLHLGCILASRIHRRRPVIIWGDLRSFAGHTKLQDELILDHCIGSFHLACMLR